jgi:hypothetical protein
MKALPASLNKRELAGLFLLPLLPGMGRTEYRMGDEHKLAETDLVLWIDHLTETEFMISLRSQKAIRP